MSMLSQTTVDSELDDRFPQEVIDTEEEEAGDREDGTLQFGRVKPQRSDLSMMSEATEASDAMGSQSRAKRSKTSGSWVFSKGWAIGDPSGANIVCQYPKANGPCGHAVKKIGTTTSSIIYHLRTAHSIDKHSVFEAVNNVGPLDVMLRAQMTTGFSVDMFQERLLRFVVAHSLSFSLVESQELQELLRIACRAQLPSAVSLPSRRSLCRNIDSMFGGYKEHVMRLLAPLPNLFYTLDAWTSEQRVAILGVTAHWIDDSWKQRSCVIGFEPLSGPHTGPNLAMAFLNVLRDMNLVHKPFFITTDNASNMLSMAHNIGQQLQAPDIFFASTDRICCIAHIINLAAQVTIQDALKAPVPEDELADDNDDGGEVSAEEDAGSLLRRFRAGVRRIRSSPQGIEHYQDCCRAVESTRTRDEGDVGASTIAGTSDTAVVDQHGHMNTKMLVLDVRPRWNSTFHMIQRGLKMQRAYNITCLDIPALRQHVLTDAEWETLQQVAAMLQPFADLTAVLGRSRYPSHSSTIIGYNVLIDHLEDYAADRAETYPQLVRAAEMAKSKLLQYYARTDDQPLYAIATAMDPRAKYQWWKDEEWEEKYVEAAIKSVEAEWAKYKPMVHDEEIPAAGFRLFRRRLRNDQLAEYVAEPPADESINVLEYWSSRASQWPDLAQMARRYLAIPASSAPSERCFSAARYAILD